jgi:hypothetical protein
VGRWQLLWVGLLLELECWFGDVECCDSGKEDL